ncbi:DUF3263 domain-containing protein [Streptomyces sp. NPDC059761]|uniref:DUF3263 domain-containing protein n=1 Tax=Streptomyces sp. NPDC059761 TaxID=3346937 RepID=UPI0036688C6F
MIVDEIESGPEEEERFGDLHRAILDADDRLSALAAGPREKYIRESLGLQPVRYFQLLNWLLDEPEAWKYKPQTVKRRRRLRDESRRKYW